MTPPLQIEYLAQHPEHVATLARLHLAEWQALLPGWSYAMAFAELASHGEGPAIPSTVVALDGATLLGSCSLLANDPDDVREFSPWLASLYVLEPHRCRGVGRALTDRIVADAAALGVATLYLYTHDAQPYYERCGWRRHSRYRFGTLDVDVMSIAPAAALAAARAGAAGAH